MGNDNRFLYIYKLTTTSATQVFFGNYSTFSQTQIAMATMGTTIAVVRVPNTGTTVTLFFLKCNGTNYTTYGSSFSINLGSTGTL